MEKNLVRVPSESIGLHFLYKTIPGRLVLKVLTAKWVSDLAGFYLDSAHSKKLIAPFVRSNSIDLKDYEPCDYKCFNEFFCRKIRPELRPMDMDENHLMSPCDGLLSVYPIKDGVVMNIKQSKYSVKDLLQDAELAAEFDEGTCLVFRLCVNHYHRYHFAEAGKMLKEKKISGLLHTVRPIALRALPVFTENSREYAVYETKNFGKMVQMEVGAMLVGKIDNHPNMKSFERGQEKGRFLYGGSTVILMLQKDQVQFPDWFKESASPDLEIPVQMGQCLGYK